MVEFRFHLLSIAGTPSILQLAEPTIKTIGVILIAQSFRYNHSLQSCQRPVPPIRFSPAERLILSYFRQFHRVALCHTRPELETRFLNFFQKLFQTIVLDRPKDWFSIKGSGSQSESMQNAFHLCFSGGREPKLSSSEFTWNGQKSNQRGKARWTSNVKARCFSMLHYYVWLLKFPKENYPDARYYEFLGRSKSPAAMLTYAMAKDKDAYCWWKKVFGERKNDGHSNFWSLVDRINPEQKDPRMESGLKIDRNKLAVGNFTIELDGALIKTWEAAVQLADDLLNQTTWKNLKVVPDQLGVRFATASGSRLIHGREGMHVSDKRLAAAQSGESLYVHTSEMDHSERLVNLAETSVEIIKRYLENVDEDCRVLRRRLFPPVPAMAGPYEIDTEQESDFIPLYLVEQGERVRMLDAMRRYRRLLLVGRPGAGKTTLALITASALRRRVWKLPSPSPGGLTHPLPVLIRLPSMANTMQSWKQPLGDRIGLEFADPLKFIKAHLTERGLPIELVEQTLGTGHYVFLFDGLDEVPTELNIDTVLRRLRLTANAFFALLRVIEF